MATTQQPRTDFVKAISRLDATALVVGSMIGSGIFIVSADILRQVHAPGVLLLVWALSGVVTLMGALSYGELAAMFPRAGGQYVYLREGISPLFGYLYGWTLFLVIQTGTIAAVAVAFARFTAVLVPAIDGADLFGGLSAERAIAIALIVALTLANCRGITVGKTIQNVFTVAKIAALIGVIVLCAVVGSPQLAWQSLSAPRASASGLSLAAAIGSA